MEDGEETRRLLTEIRDTQREHLAEYRRVTTRSLELQQSAVERQAAAGSFLRRVTFVIGFIVLMLMILLVIILSKSSRAVFGM